MSQDDYVAFNKVNARILNTSRELKNVPIRIYVPQSPGDAAGSGAGQAGSFKVVQSLIQPRVNERTCRSEPHPIPYPHSDQIVPWARL